MTKLLVVAAVLAVAVIAFGGWVVFKLMTAHEATEVLRWGLLLIALTAGGSKISGARQ